MVTNYLKIACRQLTRQKISSIINILGLAVGMACTIILLLFVWNELSYDRHNSKFDRIFIAQTYINMKWDENIGSYAPLPLGKALKEEYPAIEAYARFIQADNIYFVDQESETICEKNIAYADQNIFKVFDYKFIYGSPDGSLEAPDTIVLSQSLATKYFGDENPVGKILSRKDGISYVVKGVFKDLPLNSSNRYDALITSQNLSENFGVEMFAMLSKSFKMLVTQTYILLSEHAEISDITNDYKRFNAKYIPKNRPDDDDWRFLFQPLKDVYTHSTPWPNSPVTVLQRIYIFSVLALFILVIACINYMNLATARSTGRAREVGVRKVLGADRRSVIRQFICESVTITILAMLAALVLIEVALPSFNNLIGKELNLGAINPLELVAGLLFISLFIGIAAGSYPAFVLSSFLPVKVLKAGPQSGTSRGLFRKILVVIQFAISVSMIICTIMLIKQMNYVRDMDLGFKKENVFYIRPTNNNQQNSILAFKETLRNHTGISSVAISSLVPGMGYLKTGYKIEDTTGNMVQKGAAFLTVDDQYIDLMEMKILEGRSFNPDTDSDRAGAILVNEVLVKEMGWTDSPIGKRIAGFGPPGATPTYKVIGVVKNFHIRSLRDPVEPTTIVLRNNDPQNSIFGTYISIKINPEDSQKTFEFIKKKWLELNPSYPPEIVSLEDTIDSQYRTDKAARSFFVYFAFLGIFISCLGLFGLSSFLAESNTKEIGVRKVLGASVSGIIIKFSFQFIKLVLIASIFSCPFAFYVISKWLDNFSYKTEISWTVYLVGICIAILIALGTVGYHAVKAALNDPVKALRYE